MGIIKATLGAKHGSNGNSIFNQNNFLFHLNIMIVLNYYNLYIPITKNTQSRSIILIQSYVFSTVIVIIRKNNNKRIILTVFIYIYI